MKIVSMILVSILFAGCTSRTAEDRAKAEAYCSKYNLDTIALSSAAVPINSTAEFACQKKGEDVYQIVPAEIYHK